MLKFLKMTLAVTRARLHLSPSALLTGVLLLVIVLMYSSSAASAEEPQFVNTSHSPLQPTSNDNLEVSLTLNQTVNVTHVNLFVCSITLGYCSSPESMVTSDNSTWINLSSFPLTAGHQLGYRFLVELDDGEKFIKIPDNSQNYTEYYLVKLLDSFFFGVNISNPPSAQIDSISPSPAEKGTTVVFEGHGNIAGGNISNYTWRSSLDGNLSIAPTFNSSSLSLGTHIISFTVQDDNGFWTEPDTNTLWIYTSPIAITGEDTKVKAGETVQFSGSGTDEDGTIVKYEWDFNGDGVFEWSSNTTGLTTFIYNDDGTYSAVLRVTDNDSFTGNQTITITVENKDDDGKAGLPALSTITVVTIIAVAAFLISKKHCR